MAPTLAAVQDQQGQTNAPFTCYYSPMPPRHPFSPLSSIASLPPSTTRLEKALHADLEDGKDQNTSDKRGNVLEAMVAVGRVG